MRSEHWGGLTIKRLPLLSEEEERRLGKLVRENGDIQARNKLIEHHLLYVIFYAKKFAWSKLEPADLVQSGNLGLIRAAEKYDERMNRFSTYAVWWIKAFLWDAVHNSSIIRLPLSVYSFYRTIKQTSKTLAEELGRSPYLKEVAERMDEPLFRVKRTLEWVHAQYHSLDAPVRGTLNDEEQATLGELLSDTSSVSPELRSLAEGELEEVRYRIEQIRKKLREGLKLSERDQAIFKRYHGLDVDRRYRLDELSEESGVSRQRIQQIIDTVWKRLEGKHARPNKNPLLVDLHRHEELESILESSS